MEECPLLLQIMILIRSCKNFNKEQSVGSIDIKKGLYDYYENVQKTESEILTHEVSNVDKAAQKIVEALKNGKKIWGYGPGHANEFLQALLCTPAGIPFISSIFAHVRETIHDNVEGLGSMLGELANFQKGDVFIFISISGKHTLPIEIVKYAQEKGVFTIGLTSVTYSSSSKPNNKWNARLFEAVDLCFDNHVGIGDACVHIDGVKEAVAPVSGVMSMFLAEMLTAAIAQEMEAQNMDVPVWHHPNLPSSSIHNKKIITKTEAWVNYFHL